MITIKELLTLKTLPNPLFLHAIDILQHILKGDKEKTYFNHSYKDGKFRDELIEELEHTPPDPQYMEIRKKGLHLKRGFTEVKSDQGNLDIASYIAAEDDMFFDVASTYRRKPSLSLLYETVIPYNDRGAHYVEERHRKAYALGMKCKSQNQPYRIMAGIYGRIDEIPHPDIFRAYIMIKDYPEPIWPSTWQCLATNRICNSWLNCFCEYILGTSTSGNLWCDEHDPNNDLGERSRILCIDPKYTKGIETYE